MHPIDHTISTLALEIEQSEDWFIHKYQHKIYLPLNSLYKFNFYLLQLLPLFNPMN